MKGITLHLALTIIIAGLIFTGCQSPDEKVASAQAKVDDANQKLDAAQNNADTAAQKAADDEEWAIFRNESEAKIKDNEIRIASLKKKVKEQGNQFDTAYSNRIDTLAQRNKDMQARIDAYAKKQDSWASFKLDFSTDIDGLANALKDIAVTNKGQAR